MRDRHRKTKENRRTAKPSETGAGRNFTGRIKRPGRSRSLYEASAAWYAGTLGLFLLLDVCISYLFFHSAAAFALLLLLSPFFFLEQKKGLERKQKNELTRQFLDAIQLMLSALQAGYSPENALREALKELQKIYDAGALIVREFFRMDTQIRMNRSIERVMMEFALRTGISDVESFAEVFLTTKRTGGDLISVIRNTISCIRQKQETMQEIETCLAGRVMEQNVMSMIPILILAYVSLTSPGFLDVMYETSAGTATMAVCFAVYLFAYVWGLRIVRIEV